MDKVKDRVEIFLNPSCKYDIIICPECGEDCTGMAFCPKCDREL